MRYKYNIKYKSKKILLCVLSLLILFFSCAYKIKLFAGENDEPIINNATPKIKLESPSVIKLNAGDEKDIDLTIRNTGAAMAYNILVQANIDANAPFSIYFLNDSNSIPVISGTGKKIIKLRVKADKNAKAGSYNISLKHSFTNDVNTNYNESDSFSIKIENPVPEPIINLSDFVNTNANIMPGEQFSLSAIIKNLSSRNANELQISLEGLKTDEINLANSTTGTYYPSFLAGMQKYLAFDFIVSTKIKSGSYPINFKINYKDDDGKTYDKSFVYYVKVGSENKNDKPLLELSDIISPVKNFNVDEKADIYLKLKNNGLVDIKNIKVSAIADSDGAIVPRTSNINLISLLKSGASKDLLFSFSPTSKAKTQNYAIKFLVEYENGNFDDNNKAQTESFEQYASINANNPSNENSDQPESKPKLIVSNYSTDPLIVTAGSEFNLNLEFKNTHKNKRIENAKVSLTIDEATTSSNEQKGNVFTPVNGSTNFFIGDINPGAVINKKLRLYTVPTANPKNYSVTVDFEYENEKHTEIKSSEKIGINVKQATKLDTSEINIPTEAYVNQPSVISFDFYNTGKVNLNNLLIKIEGDGFDAKQSANYYGKFNTSTSDSYEGNFTPLEAGEKQGQIIISYEDDTGETQTQIKDFVINVSDMPAGPQGFDENMQPANLDDKANKKSGLKKILIWSGVGLAALIFIIVLIKKIRAKKKDMDLDE